MRKGNIFDFLELVVENAELQRDLVEFAVKHGFDFTASELSDEDLDSEAGGRETTA